MSRPGRTVVSWACGPETTGPRPAVVGWACELETTGSRPALREKSRPGAGPAPVRGRPSVKKVGQGPAPNRWSPARRPSSQPSCQDGSHQSRDIAAHFNPPQPAAGRLQPCRQQLTCARYEHPFRLRCQSPYEYICSY